MPNIDQVVTDFKTLTLVPLLAPYQPNVPPTYPNSDPRAGTIAPTLINTGHPIQYDVTTRVENQQCQVSVYADQTDAYEKLTPFIDQVQASNIPSLSGAPPSGIIYRETGRSVRRVIVEIWAYSIESRGAIADIIRPYLEDAFRVTHADGSVSLWIFKDQIDYDRQQIDTIYVRRIKYDCDFVTTEPIDITEILDARARLAVDDQLTNVPTSAGSTDVTIAPTTSSALTPPWENGKIHP